MGVCSGRSAGGGGSSAGMVSVGTPSRQGQVSCLPLSNFSFPLPLASSLRRSLISFSRPHSPRARFDSLSYTFRAHMTFAEMRIRFETVLWESIKVPCIRFHFADFPVSQIVVWLGLLRIRSRGDCESKRPVEEPSSI